MQVFQSLTGKAAKWYRMLKNGRSIGWEEIVPLFYSKFYPPSEIHQDRNHIYNFWPHDGESIAQAWGRLKSLMLKCPIHELPGNIVIDNFYARLSLQDKTLLDTSCAGLFTRNKEEVKWDLLDRIEENTEGWENDKGRESGIKYDYECIKAFMNTDNFRNLYDMYGLDSQVIANCYKAFASYLDVPKEVAISTTCLIKITFVLLLLKTLRFILLIAFCLNLILKNYLFLLK